MSANLKKNNENNIAKRKIKRVSVSSKRQISIPKEFAESLNIGNEIILELINNRIVIRSYEENHTDFSEEILNDLIDEGFYGDELKQEFKRRKQMIRPAIEKIAEEAMGEKAYATLDEMLDDEEDQ